MRSSTWRAALARALAITLSGTAALVACVEPEPEPEPGDEPPAPTTSARWGTPTCGPAGFGGWSFDGDLGGWTMTGTAFANQPTYGDNVLISRTDGGSTGFRFQIQSEIGGNYWKVPMRIGRVGDGYLGTYEDRPLAITGPWSAPWQQAQSRFRVRGDGARGWLVSDDFLIGSDQISFMLGGGAIARERVELLVATSALCPASGCIAPLRIEGGYAVVAAVTPSRSSEQMRRVVLYTDALRGATARLRIIDDSAGGWGHLNVDDVRCEDTLTGPDARVELLGPARTLDAPTLASVQPITAEDFQIAYGYAPGVQPPPPPPLPKGRLLRVEEVATPDRLFGLADVHAHLMMELGFGGNVIFGHLTDGMGRLIAGCNGEDGHWPGYQGPIDEEVHGSVLAEFEKIGGHIVRGVGSNTHNQATFEALRRAWEGGLRVVTLQATHHQPLEWLVEADRDDAGRSTEDIVVIRQQIERARQLFPDSRDGSADPRFDFAQIVYTPAEARAVVASGRLAVILGVETADVRTALRFQIPAGRYAPLFSGGDSSQPEHDVDVYYDLGIRQITPIHAVDNAVGGAAMFEENYETAQYVSNGQPFDASADADPAWNLAGEPYWRIAYQAARLLGIEQLCPLGGIADGGDYTPFPMVWRWHGATLSYESSQPWCVSRPYLGETVHNRRGLSPYGRRYLKRMMHHGMLIDTDHMSRATRGDVYGSLLSQLNWVARYPTLSSHSDFADLFEDGTAEERRTRWELAEIAAAGGMVGPIPNTVGRSGSRAALDASMGARANRFTECGGSTDDYAAKLAYAIEQMGGRGVALGSDWNSPSSKRLPRFGYFAAYWSPSGQPLVNPPTEDAPIDGARRSLAGIAARSCGANLVDRANQNGVCYDDYGWCGFDPLALNLNGGPWWGQQVTRLERTIQLYDEDWPSDDDWDDSNETVGRLEIVPTGGTADSQLPPDGLPRANWDAPLKRWRPASLWLRDANGQPLLDALGRPRTTHDLRQERGFDINTDRLTTAGLLPDLLQELHNVGMTPEELGTLMYSAEDYIDQWERAQRAGALLDGRSCLDVDGCAP